jgi:hypothetical protein
MPTDAAGNREEDDSDAPSLRQRLHSATGDRDAEAEALADRAGDAVSEEEAQIAVREAHGDIEPATDSGESARQNDLASVADAEAVRDEESN